MSNLKHFVWMGVIVGATVFIVHAAGLSQIVMPQS